MLHFSKLLLKHNLLNLCVLLFFVLFTNKVHTELKVDRWFVHTSVSNPLDIDFDEVGRFYIATNGGLLVFNSKSLTFETYNSGNGLLDNELTCVHYLPSIQTIVLGSNSGVLTFVDKNLNFNPILDILKSSFSNKAINSISSKNNLIYIGTGFGIVVFDVDRMIFRETIPKLGQFSSGTQVNKIFLDNDKIFVATNEGIAYANLNSFLQNPNSWTNLVLNNSDRAILDITKDQNGLYLSTKNSIYKFENDSLKLILTDELEIKNLLVLGNQIHYSTGYLVMDLNKNRVGEQPNSFCNKVTINNTQFGDDNSFIYLYRNNGIGFLINGQQKSFVPNSPISNLFYDLNFDEYGNLWIATGRRPSNGFMKYDGEKWQNYTVELYSEMKTNGIVAIEALNDSVVYASTWGRGVMVLNHKTNKFDYIDQFNSPLKGVDANFLAMGKLKQDRNGTMWFVNYGETTQGPLLVAQDKNKKFYSIQNCRNATDRWYYDLLIDDSGTKWIASTLNGGLMYYNEKGTLENINDDICGSLLTSSFPNLPSNEQTALALDKNGFLWIGTPSGLASIYNPSAVLLNQKPIVRSIKALSQQSINDIYVDAVDNKWIATNEGVWVLNSDASEVLALFNVDNSPLKTNRIRSITGNPRSGSIYIGTDVGLFEVKTYSIMPLEEYKITCYPQPFDLRTVNEMIIDGLAPQSEVWITTTNGSLVRRITTNSKTVVWDGRDENGAKVGTGIYLVNAQSKLTNKTSVQKIAVMN